MTKLTKQQKNDKSIAYWERQKVRPRGKMYLVYMIFIVSLIYMIDEVASQIGMLMKTEIAIDLFPGDKGAGLLDIISILGVPFQVLGLLYRPLADKWGRKIFLVINTFGMSLALLVIFLAQNMWVYFLAACVIQFFIPHDMHAVYIMESTPPKHRAKIYSCIKFVATLGVMLVPLLRKFLMQSAAEWREVYMIPAIIGLVTSFIALLLAKETEPFIETRLAYLNMSEEERVAEKKNAQKAQGGLFTAFKFAMKHRQLRWLYIVTAFANLGFIGTINYQITMSYTFAESLFGNFGAEAINAVSIGPVTAALLLFPVGCATSQLFMGFISDKWGRKPSAIVMAALSLVSFLVFFFGAKYGMNAYVVGLFCGSFIGSYYALNDVIIMMVGESSPTNLRSSTMSAQFIVTAAGVVVSFIVWLPISMVIGNQAIGITSLCLLVPGFIAALVIMWIFTADTKGVDMEKVTGLEWDKPSQNNSEEERALEDETDLVNESNEQLCESCCETEKQEPVIEQTETIC